MLAAEIGSLVQAKSSVGDLLFFHINQTEILYLGKNMGKERIMNIHRGAVVEGFRLDCSILQ
jgi:hypothetical protein